MQSVSLHLFLAAFVCILPLPVFLSAPVPVLPVLGEHCDRIRRIQDKMTTNLSMAKERLQLLGTIIAIMVYFYIRFRFFSLITISLISSRIS